MKEMRNITGESEEMATADSILALQEETWVCSLAPFMVPKAPLRVISEYRAGVKPMHHRVCHPNKQNKCINLIYTLKNLLIYDCQEQGRDKSFVKHLRLKIFCNKNKYKSKREEREVGWKKAELQIIKGLVGKP